MMKFDQKTTLRVGNKVTWKRIIGTIIVVILVSALFTGFGYLPFWIFLIVLVLGLTVTLPACFNSYWMIYDNSLKIFNFSKNDLVKLEQLLGIRKMDIKQINYSDIKGAEFKYQKKQRVSPFDVSHDFFKINFKLKNGLAISLPIEPSLTANLTDFQCLLERNGVRVTDSQHIISILNNGDSLFEHFNQ
ncbi:XRE family transcriptional regulator [Companilactobacillus zhachilii]|uniref:XRE family transcriptional regulator n=1 Tax=Companilactobacillus zhachilii TaxID=2304606 RepID=UPI004033B795